MEKKKTTADAQEELMHKFGSINALEQRRTEMDERRKYTVESGSREEYVHETRELLEMVKVEYEDRKSRLDTLNTQIQLDSKKLIQINQRAFDLYNEYEQAKVILRGMQNQQVYLENLLRDPFSGGRNAGARSIMKNKHAIHGILGVIGQEIHAKDGYEQAVSEVLGGAMYSIVTTDEEATRNAIRFLKRNQSGRATFLPVTVCQKRSLSQDALVICSNTKGYLGVASEFVECEPAFQPVVDYLLNAALVVDSMEAGNELSSLTQRRYNIVTTDGEVIHRGGSMTGGKLKRNTTPITVQHDAEEIRRSIDAQTARVELARRESEKAISEREEITRRLQQTRIDADNLERVVYARKAKLEKLKNELALLAPDHFNETRGPQTVC